MDLLASIVGYLGAVTGIIVAIAVSYNAVVSKPLDAPHMPASTFLATHAGASKLAKAKTRRMNESRRTQAHADKSFATAAGAPQRQDRARPHPQHLANEHLRRQRARGRQYAPRAQRGFAYRSAPRAPYALGYAQAPRETFGDGSYE